MTESQFHEVTQELRALRLEIILNTKCFQQIVRKGIGDLGPEIFYLAAGISEQIAQRQNQIVDMIGRLAVNAGHLKGSTSN